MSVWIDNLIEAEWKLFRLLLFLIMGDEIGKLTKNGRYSEVSIINPGRSRLLEFENKIVLVIS